MRSVKLLFWEKVPHLMIQLWSYIKRNYFHASGLNNDFERLKVQVSETKWNIRCVLAKGAHKCLQTCLQKKSKPLTKKELMICMTNQTFLKRVNDIDSNYKLTESSHIVGLLHDCDKVGMDLNLVWQEIEKQGQLFPGSMLSVLQNGPLFLMSTLEAIAIEKLMTPIKELLNKQEKMIEDLQQQVEQIKADVNAGRQEMNEGFKAILLATSNNN
jgi:hypothetical protein